MKAEVNNDAEVIAAYYASLSEREQEGYAVATKMLGSTLMWSRRADFWHGLPSNNHRSSRLRRDEKMDTIGL